jgi:hypothetical protein
MVISTFCWGNNSSIPGGFQRGRSTVDQIVTIRQILEKMLEILYRCTSSIDFQAAVTLYGEREYGVKCLN